MVWLLEKTLLVRLVHLSDGLAAVRKYQTPSLRVPVEGSDEISLLARNLNETLETLEQSRAALYTKQELLHSVLTNAPVIIFALDLNGRVTLLEGNGLKRLGIHSEEIIGQSIYAADSPLAMLAGHVQPGSHETIGATVLLRDTTFDVRYTSLRNRAGVLQGVVVIATDISEHKRAEAQHLEAERTRLELEKERELLQANERFISMTSHEFRTPITVILSAKESLQAYYDRMTPQRRNEHFDHIEEQSRRILSLLDDLLTLSKTQNPKSGFMPRRKDFPVLCQHLFEEVRLTDHGQHCFVFTSSKASFQMDTDEDLVRHIVVNLLSNAMKYSPQGTEVRLEVLRDDADAVIRVSDRGIGIPEADQQHLFQAFYRASNTKGYKGTGLGLAIVKESVEAHGGSITCESAAGQGTRFTVRLPLRANQIIERVE